MSEIVRWCLSCRYYLKLLARAKFGMCILDRWLVDDWCICKEHDFLVVLAL